MAQSWKDREGATLAALIEHFSRPGAKRLWVKDIALDAGLRQDELEYRLRRLHEGQFIRGDVRGTTIVAVFEVLDKGWQVGVGQPNEHGDTVDIIIGKLVDAAERETDSAKKTAWTKLGNSVRDFAMEFGSKVAAELLTKVFLPESGGS